MEKYIKLYTDFILNPKPSKLWKFIRFFIHWFTLPLKLLIIGSMGFYQIFKKRNIKVRSVPPKPSIEQKRHFFSSVLTRLPVFRNDEIELYVNRVPYFSEVNGSNHNTDHQCSRHGTYTFLMDKLGLRTVQMDQALAIHMQGKWLLRGYGKYEYDQEGMYMNAHTTSGDMLCGLSLGILTSKDNTVISYRFDELIANMIDNDYSLLEGGKLEPGDPGFEMQEKLLKEKDLPFIEMKSSRGMWQPGLETVGAQALTILSALRIADKKFKNLEARKHYNKLIWKYGYGLLSLLPTAYIDSKRGYFNDHNCMIALYVLSKLADNRLGKFFWKLAMKYVWSLSKHWYNGYFTGLLEDAHPGTVSESYIQDCQAFLYENKPRFYGCQGQKKVKTNYIPVNYNYLEEDEFSPDVPQDEALINSDIPDALKLKTGLGFIAHAIMLEKNPKVLIND